MVLSCLLRKSICYFISENSGVSFHLFKFYFAVLFVHSYCSFPDFLYEVAVILGTPYNCTLLGVADRSLARPGRKQATATKLGIYSTHSPRSSIHFLVRCSNLCKQLKKKSEGYPSNQVSAAAMTSASDEKWRPFNCFSVQGTGGSPTGPDPENWVGDQDNGSPGRPVSSGLQVPSEPGHCRARTRPTWWTSRGVFASKCPSIVPTEISNTPRW